MAWQQRRALPQAAGAKASPAVQAATAAALLRGGGMRARERRPRRTSRRPHTGPRSAGSAPRWRPPVCQSHTPGVPAASWPHWARHTPQSAPLRGAYSPDARPTRGLGAGTCRRSRRRNSATDQVMRRPRARAAPSPFPRERQVTSPSPQGTSRGCARGPPRIDRARSVRPPSPGGYRSRMSTSHRGRPSVWRRVSPWRRVRPAGQASWPRRGPVAMAATRLP
jgi:hypothetical protein